jgi:hypothetical protein
MTLVNQSMCGRRVLAIGGVMIAGLCWLPAARAGQAEASVAIARAEAKVELVSRESPAATQDPSFAAAQSKLNEARAAAARNQDQAAEWRANEAEQFADITAGGAQLAGLERTRAQVGHAVEVLASEVRK